MSIMSSERRADPRTLVYVKSSLITIVACISSGTQLVCALALRQGLLALRIMPLASCSWYTHCTQVMHCTDLHKLVTHAAAQLLHTFAFQHCLKCTLRLTAFTMHAPCFAVFTASQKILQIQYESKLSAYLQHIGRSWDARKRHPALHIAAATGAPRCSSQAHAFDCDSCCSDGHEQVWGWDPAKGAGNGGSAC